MPIIDPDLLRQFYDSIPRKRESFEQYRFRIYTARADEFAQGYTESGNPIDAMQAALLAMEGGIPMPAPVSKWLSHGFSMYIGEYAAKTPDRSLDRSLNLSPPGRGRQRPEDELESRRKRENVEKELGVLMGFLKLSLEQAAGMVAARLSDPATRKPDEPVYSRDTLIKYARKSSIIEMYRNLHKFDLSTLQCNELIQELWRRELSDYPAYSLPPELKSRFAVMAEDSSA